MYRSPLSSTGAAPATHYISSGLVYPEFVTDALSGTNPDYDGCDVSSDTAQVAMARVGVQPIAEEIFDYYVSSTHDEDGVARARAGSDVNDGLTPATPFATISALPTITAGMRIGLDRGSYFREQIATPGADASGVVVGAYGAGRLPILDAADVAGAWAKTAGRTSIYDQVWTFTTAVGEFLSLWEDGVRLRWVASLDLCDATAGTYYVPTLNGTSTTIYVHATGSGDPDSNGKTYEISRRHTAITAGINWIVSDTRGKRPLNRSGALLGGVGAEFHRCIGEDGTSHNIQITSGGRAVDCIGWKCDWNDRVGFTTFVAFAIDGRASSAEFVRCISVLETAKVLEALSGGHAIDGFYAHTASSSNRFDSISYLDCAVSGALTGFAAGDVDEIISARNFGIDCRFVHSSTATLGAQIDDLYGKSGSVMGMVAVYMHLSGETTLNGLRAYGTTQAFNGDVYNNSAGGTVRVERSVIVHVGGFTRFAINGNSAGSTIESEGNILFGGSSSMAFRQKGSGLSQNNNYYPSGADYEIGASSYTTFAAYRTANPTYDVNSITTDPLLNDPANGDFGLDPASPAIALGAGLERPDVTYTAIPSDAEIAAM